MEMKKVEGYSCMVSQMFQTFLSFSQYLLAHGSLQEDGLFFIFCHVTFINVRDATNDLKRSIVQASTYDLSVLVT